jgi:pSer/pThr/pTyr-binding forkhead associated (FHA) protein
MPAVLTVREAGAERRVVFESRAVVGRDPDCDVVLSSRSVSRRHAMVERDAGGWVVRDLGSANGVFVEGKRLAHAVLASGASLRFGDVEAAFEDSGVPRTSSAERLAKSLSVKPARTTRTAALVAAATLSIVALVAATVWTRFCDHGRASAPAAAPR